MAYDLIIKNGFIVDGTGNPGFYGDVGIKEGKICDIRSAIEADAARIIDAKGLILCPGFIDPHVHEELTVLHSGKFEEFLRQGVTTLVNGNCGHSITPYDSDNIYEYMNKNGLISDKAKEENKKKIKPWSNLSEYVEVVKESGSNLNMGFLLGHGTLRWSVMGGSKDRKPTFDENKQILELIEEGMEQGALGISTGLSYIPSKYADIEELKDVARILKKHDGIYTSHIRYYLGELQAVKEAIEIGESAGIRVQISHLTPSSPESFDEILLARERGVEVAVDTIPKSSGHCKRKDRMIQFIISASSELFELGVEGFQEALKTEKGRKIILNNIRFKDDLILIKTGDPSMENKSIKQIAKEKGIDPDELILNVLEKGHENITFWQGGLRRHDFPGIPFSDNIAFNPLVMVGSDRIFGEIDDPYAWYELFRKGAFPIFFKLNRAKGVRLEEIVRRVTSLPAQQFRLSDRGMVAIGKAADITIIDMDNFNYPSEESIDYTNPLTLAEGVKYTIVNGNVVLDNGDVRETKAGQVLTKYGKTL